MLIFFNFILLQVAIEGPEMEIIDFAQVLVVL